MKTFVDTSALFAIFAANDIFHDQAGSGWIRLIDEGVELHTTNYVLLETAALLQARVGLDAVRALTERVEPLLTIAWIGNEIHRRAAEALLAANRRQLGLVDMTSFLVMRDKRIDRAFTFDAHFAEQGFEILPAQ